MEDAGNRIFSQQCKQYTGTYSDYMQLGKSARINPQIDLSSEWMTAQEIVDKNVGSIQESLDQMKFPMTGMLCGIIMLITLLMEKLFIVREKGEIAMMKSVGFRNRDIRIRQCCLWEFWLPRQFYNGKCAVRMVDFQVAVYEDRLLCGDLDRALEVFENIMENALKYGDGRRIELSFSEEDYCQLIRFLIPVSL